MANHGAPDRGADLGPVDVTISVVREPGSPDPGRHAVRVRSAVKLAFLAVLVATAVAALLASSGPRAAHASGPAASGRGLSMAYANAVPSRFGVRAPCLRFMLVTPDDSYARLDIDRYTPCETYANYLLLILHRVRGAWVRVFETSSWTCPTRVLAPKVVQELQLCPVAR